MPFRKPQSRCKCGHAKSRHGKHHTVNRGIDYSGACGFCWEECLVFRMDNLATLERLNEFKENKEREVQVQANTEELSL